MKKIIEKVGSWFVFDVEIGGKYRTLAVIRGLLKVFAWLFLIIGALMSVGIIIFGGTPDMPRSSFIVIVFFVIIEFMFLYLIAEIINMMVNIENNTQKTARLLGGREEK